MKRNAILLIPIMLLLLDGCAAYRGEIKGIPNPYESELKLKTSGEKVVDYEILGEGYGESSAFLFVGGIVFYSQPDQMTAYKQAVASKGGDILLEARTQMTTRWFVTPFLITKRTFKIWGIVAKIKAKA